MTLTIAARIAQRTASLVIKKTIAKSTTPPMMKIVVKLMI